MFRWRSCDHSPPFSPAFQRLSNKVSPVLAVQGRVTPFTLQMAPAMVLCPHPLLFCCHLPISHRLRPPPPPSISRPTSCAQRFPCAFAATTAAKSALPPLPPHCSRRCPCPCLPHACRLAAPAPSPQQKPSPFPSHDTVTPAPPFRLHAASATASPLLATGACGRGVAQGSVSWVRGRGAKHRWRLLSWMQQRAPAGESPRGRITRWR